MADHDLALDLVVTPERVIDCRSGSGGVRRSIPSIRWDRLTDDKVAAIPLLVRLRP